MILVWKNLYRFKNERPVWIEMWPYIKKDVGVNKFWKYMWRMPVWKKRFEYMKKIKVWMGSSQSMNTMYIWTKLIGLCVKLVCETMICIYENRSNLIELGESMHILTERINVMRSMCMINIWKKYVSRWVCWSFDS